MKIHYPLALVALLAGGADSLAAEAGQDLVPGLFPRTPFQFTAHGEFVAGSMSNEVTLEVPSGKRLVIETVTTKVEVPADHQVTSVTVRTDVGGVTAWHEIPVSKGATFTSAFKNKLNLYGGAEQVRLYADPGSTVSIMAHRDVDVCPPLCGSSMVYISGYLISEYSPSLAP